VQQDRANLERAKEQQEQMIDSQRDELRQLQLDIDRQKVIVMNNDIYMYRFRNIPLLKQ